MKGKLIREVFEKYAATVSGELGVYFKDLSSNEEITHFADNTFPSASVFKIFVLAELFRQVSEGELILDDRYLLKDEDKATGSGVMCLLDAGIEPTLKDYATLMMILSDNTAADFLFKLVGRENIINKVLKPLNLDCTKCDLACKDLIAACFQIDLGADPEKASNNGGADLRNTPAFTNGLELNDITSPREVGKLLELLYHGEWVNAEIDNQVLEIMKLCQTNSRIPKYLPKGTVVAHKTGTMDRVVNDVGIVYTPKGDYILAVFYNGNTATEEEYLENRHNFLGEEMLAHMSQAIYSVYTE